MSYNFPYGGMAAAGGCATHDRYPDSDGGMPQSGGELLDAYDGARLLDLAPNASERRVMTVLILCLGVMNP